MTLMEKIETSVTPVMRRTTANAPITAMPPTRVGISAETRLPKMSRLSRNTMGSEIDSARAMSLETCSLTSPKTAQRPPMLVLRPGRVEVALDRLPVVALGVLAGTGERHDDAGGMAVAADQPGRLRVVVGHRPGHVRLRAARSASGSPPAGRRGPRHAGSGWSRRPRGPSRARGRWPARGPAPWPSRWPGRRTRRWTGCRTPRSRMPRRRGPRLSRRAGPPRTAERRADPTVPSEPHPLLPHHQCLRQ